jgi:hypothetical protein
MKTYEVEIIGLTTVEVDADTIDEAQQKVLELIKTGKYDEAVTENLSAGYPRCTSEETAE